MIDIIIPAYNTHKTIYNCLFSILNQSINDKVKVYLIDDNSNKKYDSIYDFFKNKLNIKLIRLEENKGPGFARQVGLNESNSKYVFFLDSDDVLYDSYSLENIHKNMIENDYDLIISNIIEKTKDNNIIERTGGLFSLHGKLFKRSFIKKNNISFPYFYTDEDVSFNYLFMLNNPKMGFCPDKVYSYNRRNDSLTMNEEYNKEIHIKNYCDNIKWVMKYAENNCVDLENVGAMLSFTFAYLYYCFTYKVCINDKSIKYVCKLYPFYKKYKKFIKKELQEQDLETWFSIKDKHNFEVSFNEFLNILKKEYEEGIIC